MLKCREVEQKIGSDGIVDAGFLDRLAVLMHLAMCHHCSNYARQVRAIGRATRSVYGELRVDPEDVARLIRRIAGQ